MKAHGMEDNRPDFIISNIGNIMCFGEIMCKYEMPIYSYTVNNTNIPDILMQEVWKMCSLQLLLFIIIIIISFNNFFKAIRYLSAKHISSIQA